MAVHLFSSRRRAALCAGVAACVLFSVGGKALGATTLVPDPERTSMSLTSWYWQDFVSIPTMSNLISAQNQRIIDLNIDSTSPSLTLSATTVGNSGVYKRTWWWYVGDSISDVSSQLNANDGRLIDLDSYLDNGVRKYAVVMVKNAGKAQKTWWWYVGQTTSQLSALATQNKARITDLQSEGNGLYDAIMFRNGGVV